MKPFVERHWDEIGCMLSCFDRVVMWPQQPLLHALQTMPGLDAIGAAMLLMEIGTDMDGFGSPEKLVPWAGSAPTRTSLPASARPAGNTQAIRKFGASFARRPTRPAAPAAHSPRSCSPS